MNGIVLTIAALFEWVFTSCLGAVKTAAGVGGTGVTRGGGFDNVRMLQMKTIRGGQPEQLMPYGRALVQQLRH